MITRSYTLIGEPEGVVYSSLLTFLFEHSSTCGLVIRSEYLGSVSLTQFLETIRSRLISAKVQSSWPGTALDAGNVASIHYYATDWSVFEGMTLATDRLYSWIYPSLPEDPAFYRADGALLLGTVSHERDAFLNVTDVELAELQRLAPELELLPDDSVPK